jgi:hypothetical protein
MAVVVKMAAVASGVSGDICGGNGDGIVGGKAGGGSFDG